MELLEYLESVPLPVLAVVILFLLLVTIIITIEYMKNKGLEGIRADTYQLMLQAEHTFESAHGQQKLKWVVQQARGLLPAWLQIFISEDTLMDILGDWFTEVKDLLDDGKINGSQSK